MTILISKTRVLIYRTNLLLNLIIFFSLSAFIIAQDITGNIEGRIIDSTGNPLSRVNISLLSSSLMGIRGTATSDNGYFQIISLPVGKYTVKISAVGFSRLNIEDVEVQLGKTNNLGMIVLKPHAINLPEISVSGKKPVIDPVSSTYGGNINTSYIEKLPVERSYKDMANILPQVNDRNFAGSTGGENKYFVDGVEVTDPLFQGKATDLPYNFIREVEIKTGGYGVDTRSSTGGLFNVITNSGSNEFNGSAFGFYTSNQLSDNSKLSSLGQGDFSNYDAGFGLGGPIILDKLWFYAAYNPTFYRKDVGIPGHSIYIDQTLTHKFAFKLNWRTLNNLNLIFTVNGDPIQRDQVISPNASVNYATPDVLLNKITEGSVNYSLNGTYTVSDKILLQGLVAKVDRYAHTVPATERGRNEILFWDNQTRTLSGGNHQKNWDTFRSSTYGKISAALLWDQQTIIAGIDYKYNNFNIEAEFYSVGRRNDTLYTEDISDWYGEVQSHIPALFIQDSWRIWERLTLTAGLRWEDHTVIDAKGDKVQNISVPLLPYAAFVFVPGENNRQRIFASFRRFSLEYAQLATNFNLGFERVNYYDHDPRVDNTGGVIDYEFQHPILPLQKELDAQYIDEFNLGYERVLLWNVKAAIQGVYRFVGEAIDDSWIDEVGRYEVGNPGRGLLSALPKARRDYKALVLSFERTGDQYFNFLASYVLSRNYGNYEYALNRSVSFDNPSTAQVNTTGLLSNDRTHVFKFSGYYNFSFGLTTGITFIMESGTPLSEYAWDDQDPGRKFLEKRGSVGRTPAIWDLNARITYNLKFISNWYSKLILDVFHIGSPQKAVDFDQARFWDFEETNPNNNYSQATEYQPSMSVRLGMEVGF